jgi:phosphatidate phosphatase LPIN
MNYLRGAVSAISAPYQYYKDINPATLTGAIDVIVIRRPADNGDSELVCSPFHVRFGKWQVLRPSDKQVNVFVNGTPIPFDMKIGEAGEAFFVFETDEDVPPDLITSPVLHATPDETDEEPPKAADIVGEQEKPDLTASAQAHAEREPSFLDLNDGLQETQTSDVWTTPKQTHYTPQALRRQDSKATISPSTLPLGSRDSEIQPQDQRVDEVLASFAAGLEPHTPEVEYHHGSFHQLLYIFRS